MAAPLESTKDIFEMTDEHFEQGDELGAMRPTDFPWLKNQYQKAKDAFFSFWPCPCSLSQ